MTYFSFIMKYVDIIINYFSFIMTENAAGANIAPTHYLLLFIADKGEKCVLHLKKSVARNS